MPTRRAMASSSAARPRRPSEPSRDVDDYLAEHGYLYQRTSSSSLDCPICRHVAGLCCSI